MSGAAEGHESIVRKACEEVMSGVEECGEEELGEEVWGAMLERQVGENTVLHKASIPHQDTQRNALQGIATPTETR